MKFSKMWLCALVGLACLIFLGRHGQAVPVATTENKVFIYPTADEKIDQLTAHGIQKVKNYGSYWLVEATDAQVDELTKMYGERAVKETRLNRIQLNNVSFNTFSDGPTIPVGLREDNIAGKRLRLVQFRGPVTPAWLQQVQAAGSVELVSYVPNNAYLVRLDQAAEDKLRTIQNNNGPIQWIGPYHPYYKIQRDLLKANDKKDGQPPVDVRITMVGGADAKQTVSALETMGILQGTFDIGHEKVVRMTIPVSAVPGIAKLSDVVWIEKVEPKVLLDEVQALILAGQTNGLGNGPSNSFGITNYLDFVINTIGGGLISIFDPTTYPIVDVADTGLDAGIVVQPSFYVFGNPVFGLRVAYSAPGNEGFFVGATIDSGCEALNLNFLGSEDFYGHGTRVASVIAGFDTNVNQSVLSIYSTIVTQQFVLNFLCSGPGENTNTFMIPTAPCQLTTDIVFNCTSGAVVPIILPLPTEMIVTQMVNLSSQDPSGFHFGMGVSPFGLIGSSRIWRQSADEFGTPSHVRFLPPGQPTTPCMEGLFPVLFFQSYAKGARIQNDSWSTLIKDDGSNGGQYDVDAQTYDVGVRDATLVGQSNNVPGPSPLNQEFIVVFAGTSELNDFGVSGNQGGIGDILMTAPATAKNVITVTASESVRLDGSGCAGLENEDNSDDIWQGSEFGPTLDGRFKPEIVAPGSSIYAAKTMLAGVIDPVLGIVPAIEENPDGILGGDVVFSSQITNLYCVPAAPFTNNFINTSGGIAEPSSVGTYYNCDSGSSYAAPAVSGAIQLLWWYFQHRLTNELGQALLQPSPAMAKAYVCNSARYLPITNPQTHAKDTLPSIAQGMGSLDMSRMFDGEQRLIRDESTPRAIDVPLVTTNPAAQQTYFSQSGQSYEVSGQVLDPTLPFRVSLAWLDAPGSPLATGAELVNDLDLQVTVGGVTYKGNVFAEDHSVPGGAFDNVNNMESVFLPAGTTGTWSVLVRAKNIAGDGVPNVGGSNDQDFAIVVYNTATNTLSDIPNLATNNSCQTAISLTGFPLVFSNTLSKAVYTGKVLPNPSAGRGGVEEFFKIIDATPGSTFTINTKGSTFTTVLSVWTAVSLPQTVFVRGDCGALSELVSTNGGTGSQVTFTADGSNTYYVVAEPLNNGAGGSFVLNVSATNPGISVTPPTLTFGAQTILTPSAPQLVTYQNGTTVPVQILSATFSGTNAADFSLGADTCVDSILQPGGNCSSAVVFTPQPGPTGTRSALLSYMDNATGSPRTIALIGTATVSAPLVCLSTNSTALVFPSTLLGTTNPAAQSVTITNCGSVVLNITNITLSGFGSNDFSFTSTCAVPGPIAIGSFCTINISFNPHVAGSRKANLVIVDDAGAPTTFSLTGNGAALLPAICFSSSSVDFGSVVSGSTGSVQSIIITNCGTDVLTISGLTLGGANPGDFITNSTTCTTVATGATCTVNVQFAPTTGGERTATLGFVDNASGSPQLLTLTGNSSVNQPDVAISKTAKSKKFIGVGIINTTGAGQELTQKVHRGSKKGLPFYVAVQNTGTTPDSYLVQANGATNAGFTVTYNLGDNPKTSVDVTSGVESGTFSTSTLAPGATTSATTLLLVEVFADKTVPKGAGPVSFKITFTSVSDPTKVDVVIATVTAN